MKVGMFLCIVFAMVKGWELYNVYKENPQTIYQGEIKYDFIANTKQMEYPPDFYIKMNKINTVKAIVWYALFFYVLFEITCYLEKPDEHWVNILTRLKE